MKHTQIIHRKVHNGTYHFSQYREKLLLRGADRKPRVISIPTIRDKLVQKSLAEILRENFSTQVPLLHQIIQDVIQTYRSGTYQSVIRLDVKDYYPSILHDKLIDEIRKKARQKQLIQLISNAISLKTVSRPNSQDKKVSDQGVPQGLSISNILANIYFLPIDKKYSTYPAIRYFRYVDDILIFCSTSDVDTIRTEINLDCLNRGLTLHEEDNNLSKASAGLIVDGFTYLGYQFNPSTVSVREKSVDHLRESIIKILTNYKYSRHHDDDLLRWVLNLRITGCIFDKSKFGWVFFFSQIDDLSLLGSLDYFVQSQLQRFNVLYVKPKKFLRAYLEIRKNLNRTTYIPNFDKLLEFRV